MNLKINEVEFSYEVEKVLEGISFSTQRGEFLGVIGPNGSGKTTLLKIINGLLKPKRGSVYIDCKKVSEMDERELAKEFAMVPQNTYIDFDFTVFDVVMMGRHPHLGRLSIEGSEDEEKVKLWMKLTNTLHLADRSIREVSGGERQRAIIARALAQEPRVLLLDEPTANLDICYQIEIMDLLKRLVKELGLTIICAIHDLNLASRYCDRLILLNNGRIKAVGRPEEVLTEENLRNVFKLNVKIRYDHDVGALTIIPLQNILKNVEEIRIGD